MRNLLKPLTIFIGVYLVIASVFTLGYDSNESSTYEEQQFSVYGTAHHNTESDIIQPVDTSSVVIDNVYTQLVLEQFIADADKNGLKRDEVIEHIKALDGIFVDNLDPYGLLGITMYMKDRSSPTGIRGIIILNAKLLSNPDLYMFTLYHELGHWFGLPHCDCDDRIMMNGYNKKHVEEVSESWDKSVKKFMKSIKKGWDRKGDHYAFPSFEPQKEKKNKKNKNKKNKKHKYECGHTH